MIDVDKYEGHTPAPWIAKHDLVETEAKYGGTFTHIINSDGWRVWLGESNDINDEPRDDDVDTTLVENSRFGSENLGEADAKLIADAPLLLAEVKRLREENEMLREELKNDDTGIKAIDGLLKAVGDRNEEVKRLKERLDWILGDEELAAYVWEKEVAYMEHDGVRLPWISADEWGEEE